MFRYEKETKTLDSFHLLLLEMLYGGEIFKNHDFRKEEVRNRVTTSTLLL
jgi:hypothetical protein